MVEYNEVDNDGDSKLVKKFSLFKKFQKNLKNCKDHWFGKTKLFNL